MTGSSQAPTQQRPGEADAWGAAFEQMRRRLRAYLLRRLPVPEAAEDILQDILLKALAAEREGRRIGNLNAWLQTAARTGLADYYRARSRVSTQPLDAQHPVPDGEDLQAHQELAICLRPFVEQLSPIYRDTLIAVDFEGLPLRELAAREGLGLSAVKSRAARARAMLKDKLLACCHVELEDGLVSDYQRRANRSCGDQNPC